MGSLERRVERLETRGHDRAARNLALEFLTDEELDELADGIDQSPDQVERLLQVARERRASGASPCRARLALTIGRLDDGTIVSRWTKAAA